MDSTFTTQTPSSSIQSDSGYTSATSGKSVQGQVQESRSGNHQIDFLPPISALFVVPSQTVALIHNACNPVIYINYQKNNAKYFRQNKSYVTHFSRLVQDNCVLPRREGFITSDEFMVYFYVTSFLISALTRFG